MIIIIIVINDSSCTLIFRVSDFKSGWQIIYNMNDRVKKNPKIMPKGFLVNKINVNMINMFCFVFTGHVYVVGCTNVGKSTLFNSLLSSDYCKETAREYINRATISNWPGKVLA